MKYSFSNKANRDLEEIFDYIAADSPSNAVRMVKRLRDEVRALARSPYAYALRPDLSSDARAVVAGNYLILYRIKDDQVHIERVVHGARNIPDLLQ